MGTMWGFLCAECGKDMGNHEGSLRLWTQPLLPDEPTTLHEGAPGARKRLLSGMYDELHHLELLHLDELGAKMTAEANKKVVNHMWAPVRASEHEQ